jgi:plastocyanin
MREPRHVRRPLRLPVAGLLGAAILGLPAIAGSEAMPTIEAHNAPLSWKPPTATVSAGGGVNITNPTSTPHGVEWRSGPTVPSCSAGVPVGSSPSASGANWSGTCTFSQTGTYTFWCTVHGSAMTATVTVNASGPVPTIKRLAPRKGPPAGGTAVIITGTNFTGASAVTFGSIPAASFGVNSDAEITAVAPSEPPGRVDVRVTGPGGTSAITRHDRFKFLKHK